MGKTFKDGRINREIIKEREVKRTQKHQNYGSKERKQIGKFESGMYREEEMPIYRMV